LRTPDTRPNRPTFNPPRFASAAVSRRASLLPLLVTLLSSAPVLAASGVRVTADGRTQTLARTGETVRAALAEARITLGPEDQVEPSLDSRLGDGDAIRVTRVVIAEKAIPEKIPYRIVVQPARRGLRPYHPTVHQSGRPGLKRVTYRVRTVDGQEVERNPIGEEVVRQPVDEIVISRTPAKLGSRGAYTGRRTMRMLTTAYDPGPGSCGKYANGKTCNGRRAGYGIIAVDPKVIPLGKKLFVPGYGYGISADVGGAIKGNRLDLGYNSRSGAMKWGKRWVEVTILD
jgi:3D (Asp-Asp-Asp) domain-containing protein